jgi:hypothetical protein
MERRENVEDIVWQMQEDVGTVGFSLTVMKRRENSVTARSPETWYFLSSVDLEIERRYSLV